MLNLSLSPRWRKVLRDFSENKLRTFLVVLSIAVGVFAFGAIATARIILVRELDNEYRSSNPPSIIMWIPGTFDDDLVRAVNGLRQVAYAEGRGHTVVSMEVGDDEWISLELFALTDFQNQHISIVEPDSGEWPPTRREIMVERSAELIPGVDLGDVVNLETPDGRVLEMPIGGLAYDIYQFPSHYFQQGYGYVTMDTLEYLTGERAYSMLYIIVSEHPDNRDNVEELSTTIRERIEHDGYVVAETTIPEPGKHWNTDGMQAIIAILAILGLLSLFFSGFLVVNTVNALLTQQKRQIGVMKTIGAQRRDVVRIYFALVLLFGVMALLIAFPLGVVGSRIFINFVAQMINMNVNSYDTPATVYWIQAGVSLLMPLFASLLPVLQGTQVTIHEAISDYGIGKVTKKQSKLDDLIDRLQGLPRPLMLSLRNTIRRKGRLLLTMITLTMAGAMFIALVNTRAGLFDSLDQSFALFSYDVGIVTTEFQQASTLEREARRIDAVVDYRVWSVTTGQYLRPDDSDGISFTVFAVPPDSDYVQPAIVEGRWLRPEDDRALVVTGDFTMLEPEVHLGDTITMKIRSYEESWTVVGIAKPLGDPSSTGLGYIPYEAFARMTGTISQGNYVAFRTESNTLTGQYGALRDIDEHFKQIGIGIAQSVTTGQFEAGAATAMNVMIALTLIMAVLMAVVGGLGLMGTMSLNVIERTREIGVLRAIGASNRSIWGIVVIEGVLIGAVSALLGTLLSVPVTLLLANVIGTILLDAPLDFIVSYVGVGIWFTLSCLIAALSSYLPARNAVRLSIRETLAYE